MSWSVARRELDRLGELLGLCVIAITWPVLDVFGNTPEQFVFRGASTSDIVLFPLLVALVPAAVLWLPGLVSRLVDEHAGTVAHLAAVAVALFVMFLQVSGSMLGVDGAAKAVLALTATAATVWLFHSFEAPGRWARVMAFAVPLVVGLFLFASPTGDLAFAAPPEVVELAVEPPDGGAVSESSDLEPETPRFPDIVMILMDSVPTGALLDGAGEIDPVRYPALAELAAESTWYRRYTTINAKTAIAVPAILTGKLPDEIGSPTWTSHPDTLFRLLGGTYHLTVSESPTRLCPEDWCGLDPIPPPPLDAAPPTPTITTGATSTTTTPPPVEPVAVDRGGLSRLLGDAADVLREQIALDPDDDLIRTGFEETVVEVAPTAVPTTAPAETSSTTEAIESVEAPTVDELGEASALGGFTDRAAQLPRVESFRSAIQPSSEPTLYYLHVVLPHAPFIYTETGSRYDGPGVGSLTAAAWDATTVAQQQALQMQFTDRLVGDILDDVRAAGLYDDSLVVVMSDHSSGLDDTRFFRYYDGTNASELMVTPLIVKAPGQMAAVVSDAPIESTDVLPTIADMIDVDVPWETHGTSVLDVDTAYVDPGCDDVRTYVRFGEGLFDDDDDVDTFELCADDIVPAGLEPRLGPLRADDEWATAGLARHTPYAELLGRSWTDLDAGEAVGAVTLEREGDTLEGSSPPIGLIAGRVDEPSGAEWVAVSVDGRIAGISPVFDRQVFAAAADAARERGFAAEAAENQFRVVVPSPLLHENGYEVQLAMLESVDGAVVATELAVER